MHDLQCIKIPIKILKELEHHISHTEIRTQFLSRLTHTWRHPIIQTLSNFIITKNMIVIALTPMYSLSFYQDTTRYIMAFKRKTLLQSTRKWHFRKEKEEDRQEGP